MNILSLGEKIKKLRKEKDMTLKELAGDRITAAQISHIERDKSHTSYELLDYLAQKLDVSVDYLLESKEMQSKRLTDNLILQSEVLVKCNELDKAELQINEAVKICKEYKLIDNYGKCNFLLGEINLKKDNHTKAITNYERALHFFIRNNDKDSLFKCYVNIGKVYMLEEFYKGAMLQFEFAQETLIETQNENIDIYKDLYSKMAYCYIKLDNYEKSLEYINKIDEIDKKNNSKEELDMIILKANNFFSIGKLEESKASFKKALEILDKKENRTELANIYLTLCEIYKNIGDSDKILEYSQKVYDIKKNDEDEYMMRSLFKIIDVYIQGEEYELANKYCKLALASSIKNKNRLSEYKVLKLYSDMYKTKEEYNLAIEYLQKCMNIISELDNKKELANLYIALGDLYSNTSKEKELEFYQKGVSIYKSLDII